MAPAPARVDKWGADGFVTKLPPAGVLTGVLCTKFFSTKEANGPENELIFAKAARPGHTGAPRQTRD